MRRDGQENDATIIGLIQIQSQGPYQATSSGPLLSATDPACQSGLSGPALFGLCPEPTRAAGSPVRSADRRPSRRSMTHLEPLLAGPASV
jgi:hypothetical protein